MRIGGFRTVVITFQDDYVNQREPLLRRDRSAYLQLYTGRGEIS